MDHGIYPGQKRSNDDLPIGPHENKRNRNAPSTRTEYRFLIAASDANAIFGRNGEHFQVVRNKYQSQIDVSQLLTPERVLTLFGDEDRAMNILADLLPMMAQSQGVRPAFVELRAMIHSSQAGAVIVRTCSTIDTHFLVSFAGQKRRSDQRVSTEVQSRHESLSESNAGRHDGTHFVPSRRTAEHHRMSQRSVSSSSSS